MAVAIKHKLKLLNPILSHPVDIEQTLIKDVIAGDRAAQKELYQKYFGKIPKGTKEIYRPDVVEPPLGGEVRDTVFDNIQLPAVIHAYRSPAQGTPDAYAMEMLSTLLSQGESSWLKKKLVDEEQKALFVGNFLLNLEDPGVSLAFGICNQGIDPMDVEKSMDEVVKKVQTELISENDFQKLRNQIESNFISSNSGVAGIAESLANYHMYYGDTNLINTEIDNIFAALNILFC